MTNIDIFSGFLGAGKTTLIKKLIKEAYKNEKIVLIENEFGEIGIDGGFLKEAGIQINEMNSGCICCSLVGDFSQALKKVMQEYQPERILIEPSGVGKLSDVIKAVADVADEDMRLNSFVTVADATKCRMYMKNFGEFYNNQVEHASAIILSRTQDMPQEKLEECVSLLREHNEKASIVTTPWGEISGEQILSAMDASHSLAHDLMHDTVCPVCGHHHEHEHEHDHEHHHHDHDHCCDHDHGHEHHDHDHHHHEHHHHHHHADEVFTGWGQETVRKYTKNEISNILKELDSGAYGAVLRAKGIVQSQSGEWIHFDYVPDEHDIRAGAADYTGRLCVIGSELKESDLEQLFQLGV